MIGFKSRDIVRPNRNAAGCFSPIIPSLVGIAFDVSQYQGLARGSTKVLQILAVVASVIDTSLFCRQWGVVFVTLFCFCTLSPSIALRPFIYPAWPQSTTALKLKKLTLAR